MLVSPWTVAFAATVILSIWNWAVASRIHEWTTDPKNTYLFITKRLRPQVLQRDFPFGDERIFMFYQPLYMGVAVRLARWFGAIVPATRVLHFLFTFGYVSGWMMLGRNLGYSWPSVALFLAALVTYVPVTGADGIGVGAPGTWWSRSMANAFVPWFGVLAATHFGAGGMVIWGFVFIGVLLYVHPVVAIGLIPALATLLAVDRMFGGRFAAQEVGAGAAILGAFGFSFVRGYFHSAPTNTDASIDWDYVNNLAFQRFRLWPYSLTGESRELSPQLSLALHLLIGAGYVAAVLAVLFVPMASPSARYLVLSGLNFLILVFLHIPPGEGSGVRLAILAGFGATHVLAQSGSVSVALVLTLLVLSRIQFKRFLLGLGTLLAAGLLVYVVLKRVDAVRPDGVDVSLFDWWLALTIPAVFAWYLAGCLVTMDLLPRRLHRPLTIIDWGRTAKIVQLPMYCYVLSFAHDLAGKLAAPSSIMLDSLVVPALFLATVLVNPLTAYRRRLDPNDQGLFDWARNTREDSLFHIVSGDIWFGFDFRVNTIRAITGSWKDGGICFYSDVKRFFEWDRRMRLLADGINSRSVSALVQQGVRLGAEFLVLDRRVDFQDDAHGTTVYANERWDVRAIAVASSGG